MSRPKAKSVRKTKRKLKKAKPKWFTGGSVY